MLKNLDELLIKAKSWGTKRIAIAAAADDDILKIVYDVEKEGIASCILIGEKAKIMAIAGEHGLGINVRNIIDIKGHGEAARKAVSLVREGEADLIMKGMLHTGEFLKAVLDKETGLRSDSLLSQITVYNRFGGEGLQFLTDCAININPSLEEKQKIIENCVNLARKLGINQPKVALLAPVEVVNPNIPETLDAAILSKMTERGQIKNAVVDGPLAFDNAVSPEAARSKGITGPVAGAADILMVPNLSTGNVLSKSLTYFSKVKSAAAVMGATIPIIMTSRTESPENKRLTIALASYLVAVSG